MARLRTFRASGNPVGDAGATALVRAPVFGRMLRCDPKLELRATALGPAGASALAACPALAACTELDLTGNYLGDVGLVTLLRSPHLGRLHTLKLGRNQLTDAGVTAARELLDTLLDRVRVLDLSGNRLTRVGLSLLDAVRRQRPARVEVSGNVQSAPPGDAPVAVSDLVPGLIDGFAEAARLKQRVSNPRHRADGT
jgi:hypothetical protein